VDDGAFIPCGHALLRRGRVSLQGHAYHLTFTTHDRLPVFSDFHAACAAARSFSRARTGFELLAWVLMADHAHCLLQLGANSSLGGAVQILKGSSARAVNCELKLSGPVWAAAYHDRAMRKEDDLRGAARYIVANPLRAGLVQRVGDYPFWDAVWLGVRAGHRG